MKVSVLVPVHNSAPYLEACLDSILAQSMGDIEVICVDDGSSDESPDILRRYAESDGRVRVITQGCGGVSAARNVALGHARGEYVQFVDSDDAIEPGLLAGVLEVAEPLDAQMASFGFSEWYAKDDVLIARELCADESLYGRAFSLADIQGPATGLMTPAVWHTLFRRDFLDGHGIRFHEELRTSEDLAFTYEALSCAERICLVGSRYYRYRRDASAATLTRVDRGLDGYRALEHIGAFNDGAYLKGGLVAHYVNLVLDTVRYDLYSAATASEYLELYRGLLDHWLPLARSHEELIDERYRAFYQKVRDKDAQQFLFDEYAEYRDALEFQNARIRGFYERELSTLRDRLGEQERALDESRQEVTRRDDRVVYLENLLSEPRGALDSAQRGEQEVRASYAFRIGRVLTWLPSRFKALVRRVRR